MASRRNILAAIPVFLVLCAASPVTAGAPDWLGNCVSQSETVSDAQIVVACSNILDDVFVRGVHYQSQGVAFYRLGQAYQRLGNYAKAQYDFRRVLALDPQFFDAWGDLATVSERLGPPGQMAATLDTMVRLNPNSTAAFNQACWVRGTAGIQLDIAIADCNESLRLVPDNAYALDSRCLVRFRMGEFANAIGDCDAALTLRPDLTSSLYVRGLAKLRMGFAGLGNADIAAAKALDPKIADTYAGYGVHG